MNILDKSSPSSGSGNPNQSSVSTPTSGDCLIPNSQLIPSLSAGNVACSNAGPHQQPPPPTSLNAPSSVSSSSAPHTPIDTLNAATSTPATSCSAAPNCQTDLTNGHPSRPNVSTPSSVFNNSAPNTPSMPCPSVGSDGNITSPALAQLDYGEQKMFNSGPPVSSGAPPPQSLSNNGSSANNLGMLPSPLNVPPPPPPMCNDNKNMTISNGNGNKKHCNNRGQNSFVNINANIACDNAATTNPVNKNQLSYSSPSSHMANMPPMSCMSNGPPLNGNISPFDIDGKMGGFPGEFSPHIPPVDGMTSPMMNMQRPIDCPMNMPLNMMNNDPTKMCNNMGPVGPMKGSVDQQYMQHQSKIFVFNTEMVNQAAEAVDNRQFPSIIDYHLATIETKKFLEKNSLKISNFPKQTPWMGTIRQPRMRGPTPNEMAMRGNPCFSPYNHNPPGPGPGGGPPPQWNNNQWPNQPPPQNYLPNDMKMNCATRQYDPQFNNNFQNNLQSFPLGGEMQDDNLTPKQKQHREKQLAILANLQQKFCPELNNRLPSSQSNEFPNMDQLGPNNSNQGPFPGHMQIKSEPDQMNQVIPSDPSMNYNSNFGSNMLMNNQPPPPPGNEQWAKGNAFVEEKSFTTGGGRRKGSQSANAPNMVAHQSPLSQQSVNSPNSCPISQSPGNRVPPPPYNQGLHTLSSPHPSSPVTASLSLPSPRMQASSESRSQSYTPGSVRSGPSTPADNSNCALINSPKSSQNNSSSRSNSSPGNKKSKNSSIDNDILGSFSSKSEPALMPVPSPKQIEYLNSFEGQELTIQKQPNAHFQDDINELSINNELFSSDFPNMCPSTNPANMPPDMNPNPRFPITSQSCSFDSRFNNGVPMDNFRPPNVCNPQFNPNEPNMRFPNCDNSMKPRMTSPVDMGGGFPPGGDMTFPNSMPPDGPPFNNTFNDMGDNSMSSTHLQNLQKMAPPFDMPKDGMNPNFKPMPPHGMMNNNGNQMMHPNIPQNANPRMPPNFDQPFPNMPCSDMNDSANYPNPNMPPMSYPNNYNNSPRMPANMPNDPQYPMHANNSYSMPMNSPHPMPMDPNNLNGPNSMPMMPGGPQAGGNYRMSGSRPMNANSHGPRYNSPNIQVKPDAPNTIQYLPSRPQGPTNTPPNRTPNLDFLQQSLNMGNKGPPPNNGPYYNNPNMPGPNRPMMNQNMNFGPRGPMMRPQNQHGPNSMLPMGPGGPSEMYNRPPGGPNNMMNGPNGMNSGPPPPGPLPPNSFPPQGPPPPGPPNKSNTGPVLHPDSTFNFKQTPFNLPNTSDPNYAAQFHNFQQQLYATNTRNNNVTSNPRMSSSNF